MSKVDYKQFVGALMKSGDAIVKGLTGEKANLAHAAIGVSGEAGEILDAIKKHVIYGKELDRDNVVEELGDMEFYLQALRDAVGISREEVIDANIEKLSVRYASLSYSDEAAITRADKLEPANV